MLSTMPCRCAYWPVRIDARLGEHSAVVTNAFGTCAPRSAIRSRFGVRRKRRRALHEAHEIVPVIVAQNEDDVSRRV